MTEQLDEGGVVAAADLGNRIANHAPAQPYRLDPDSALVVRTLKDDECVQATSLEQFLDHPHRSRGEATLRESSDFVRYVNRLANEATTAWANDYDYTVTAVFNDHVQQEAGWRDHTATLRMQLDPDWSAWSARNGKLSSQAEFAEHLEDQAYAVVEPDAATMLEVATTFQARRNASFSRGTRLDSGDVQLAWHEETQTTAGASGRLEVPHEFTLSLAPFVGLEPVPVTARLRYRITDGHLTIGYKILRGESIERDAFTRMCGTLGEQLSCPVLLGTPPLPVGRT